MPKPRRPENKALPSGWRQKHGAYYYRPPVNLRELWDGKSEFRLGKSLSDAYRVWANRLELHADARTMAELLDRYAHEVMPLKAPKTQESNNISVRKLRAVFGHMPIETVKPKHIYQYRDLRGKQSRSAANHDIALLSHVFTKAIEWGLCENHPIKSKVTKFSMSPRKRYIEDWEINEALKVASPFIASYIRLKLVTGLRRGDLLSIEMSDITDTGIKVRPRKTAESSGKDMVILWSGELRESIQQVMSLRRKINCEWLFHTNMGKPYVKADGNAAGFSSIWQRFMFKVLSETAVKQRFTEHDLRAKVASDTDSDHARRLLGHTTSEITDRVYRRKPELILPAK